jgi:uncharacterized protein DUF3460
MAMYESEHTRFIRELLKERPELVEDQRKGRAIWWDHMLNRDEERRQRESKVPMQPYVYQTKV